MPLRKTISHILSPNLPLVKSFSQSGGPGPTRACQARRQERWEAMTAGAGRAMT